MDCSKFDQRFLSSPLILSLPPDAISIISGSARVDNGLYLDTLSRIAVNPNFTSLILTCYEPIFTDLVARWRGFATVEQLAAGFARVLPAVPFLVDFAEEFLLRSGPGETTPGFLTRMERLSDELGLSEASTVGHGERLLDMLLSLHRLLCFRREAFLGLVNADVLFGLMRHTYLPVRYLSVRILSIYLKAADRAQEAMLSRFGVGGAAKEKVLGLWEGREVDYGFLMLLEAERLVKLSKDLETARLVNNEMSTGNSRVINSSDLSPLTADLCGVLIPRLRGPPSQSSSIVDTHTTWKNINSIAQTLRSPRPLLITGQSGSGKTYLVHQIAQVLNTLNDMISIHLGDQTDAKLLVGAYTTTDALGSFEWRAGVLTTAVREGRWLLVEDIDQAPKDVLSVLLPLMERGELVIPSRGDKITATRGFKLIATIRTASSIKSDMVAMNSLGSRLWERVNVEMPSGEELNTIIDSRFPLLVGISPTLMDVYYAVRKTYSEPSFFAISKTSLGRLISPRDLMKWCKRIHALYISAGVATSHEPLSDGVFDGIFMEAVDCFAGSLQTKEARTLIVKRVASNMHIPLQRIDLFLEGGHIPGYSDSERILVVGRAKLKKRKEPVGLKRRGRYSQRRPFATTNHAARLLEQVGVAIRLAEPVLLVGETGTGKTAVVQQLADMMRFNLTVINLSQQTESGDLLGGFKPVDMKTLAIPLKERFDGLFEKTFSLKRNKRFLDALNKFWLKQQWNRVITLWGEAVKMADQLFAAPKAKELEDKPAKKRKLDDVDRPVLQAEWTNFANDLSNLEKHNSQLAKSFAFSFVEGSLVKAARNGDWVLLDEINLAAADTLENIADLLKDGGGGSILLSEKGDVERVKAHPDFRIFACMNPATDVGKRDLPPGLRSRFTELYVTSPDQELSNLLAIIREYLGNLAVGDDIVVADIASVYVEAKRLSEDQQLVDGANQRPHYSIRTLTRTLSYVFEIASVYGLRRSLYEGFCMSFLTLLDQASEGILLPVIEKYILGRHKNVRSLISQIPQCPGAEYVLFEHYWMHKGAYPIEDQPHYIVPPSIRRNMLNLVRATATKRFPVLIQGPTSSGKTSMIEYLARKTGHKFVRINNHEHTDLQEYIGSYISDDDGRLRFQEGILVKALREGHWIVLDELNLAPTDVLEALNRLLDDNRELLIPEIQEVVRPHKDFMLFATQNPPGLYGGRKVLSRAFRNRFLELHFDDIPEDELRTILEGRCQIPPSRCKTIVAVYRELSLIRQTTRLFEQKNSFATLRDLFRWANRQAARADQSYQSLADDGYMLLAERVRDEKEKLAVKEIIERVMRVKIDDSSLYSPESTPEYQYYIDRLSGANGDVVWTKAMRRLYALAANALRNNEPVLLVGETGCGKTTVCQMLADAFGKSLFVVNAHQNTETGDIIGAQRPIRNRQAYQSQLSEDLLTALRGRSSTEITDNDLTILLRAYDSLDQDTAARISDDVRARIQTNRKRTKALFEWADGSLIQAMKSGQFFLLDEISLADDSVLERLNSVLEPARGILLAEKGAKESEIIAVDGFQFMATMNPGGDYGKKELSPALRNRFTEIWVPSMSDPEDVLQIVQAKIAPFASKYAGTVVEFPQRISRPSSSLSHPVISIRDVLAWVKFINSCPPANPAFGLLHGAALVFIDGMGASPSGGLSIASDNLEKEKRQCISELSQLCGEDLSQIYDQPITASTGGEAIQLGVFSLRKNKDAAADVSESFDMTAPTTIKNAMRVVRAMQLQKPVLLEGSPGVGKTSLISALAKASGNPLTRINLSEQTDLMDLFGSDVPVEGGQSGEFAWRDAPFLRAMQAGHWVLLDEMNLASQSVLEGLNACLDHRGETYISELNRTFRRHPDFAVFAAQNPHQQGGGRKGLPASFVNRFTVVYVDTLGLEDLQLIAGRLNLSVYPKYVSKVIEFMVLLDREISQKRSFGSLGGPWEFNLRDTLRWLGLLSSPTRFIAAREPEDFLGIIKHRFRTAKDRERVDALFDQVFGSKPGRRHLYYRLSKEHLQVGHALLSRRSDLCFVSPQDLTILKQNLPVMETIMTAITQETPCILVGPSGVGKTGLLKLLASIAGVELDEIAINSDIDTTDIVGGFEQVDITRKISKLFAQFDYHLKDLGVKCFCGDGNSGPLQTALGLCERMKSNSGLGIDSLQRLTTELRSLEEEYAFGKFHPFINSFEEVIAKARESTNASFEWVDGVLIDAIEQGRWLVLDNANLCSPSVLDRLNSLLEPNGCLVVNEHSGKDGRPKVVRPSPGFRLFLTMDPDHGELSRAMRNRGIEVFLDPLLMEKCAEEDDRERKELAKYSPSTESSMGIYQIIGKFLNNDIDTLVFKNLVYVALDHTPGEMETDMALLTRWRDHIGSSSTGMGARRMGIVQDAVKICLDLHKWAWALREDRIEYLAKLLPAIDGFKGAQPMDLPRNTPLMFLGIKASSREADHSRRILEWTVYTRVHDCVRGILEIKQVEEAIVQKATAATLEGLKGMSFLEVSASKKKLPTSMSKTDFGLPVFEFLSTVREELYDWADSRARGSTFLRGVCEDKQLQNSLLRILELLQLWHDIVGLSSAAGNKLDESVLHVYVGLLEEWAKSSRDSLPRALMQPIGQALDGFRSPFQLTTGFSMELVWNAMRPSVPASLAAWAAYNELKEIADRFDAMTLRFKGSFEVVAFQKRLLITALTDVLTFSSVDNIRKLVQGLRAEIDQLGDSQALTEPEQLEPVFRLAFDYLFRFRALRVAVFPNEAKLDRDMLAIAHFAGRPISGLLGYQAPSIGLRTSYEQVLKDIWQLENSVIDGPRSLVEARFIPEILGSIHQVRRSAIGQTSQLNVDLKTFSKQLFLNIQDVTSDRTLQLTQLLVAKIYKIITLHSEFYDGEMHEQITNWFGIVGRALLGEKVGLSRISNFPLLPASNDKFKTVADTHFAPAIHAICSDLSRFGTITLERLGSAWTHYALGCLKLYVPSCAFDPAMKLKVRRERYLRQKGDIAARIEAEKIFESRFTGQTNEFQLQYLQNQIEELGGEPPNSLIERPEESEMAQLQGDFSALLKVVVQSNPHEWLLASILKRGNEGHAEEQLFQKNLSQIAERLSRNYTIYKDLVDPVLGFLYSLKLGLGLAAIETKKSGHTESLLIPDFGGDITFDRFASGGDWDDAKLFLLWRVATRRAVEGFEGLDKGSHEAINRILLHFFDNWKAKTVEEQEKAAADASLYRYEGGEADCDEQELKAMFPDYEQEIEKSEKPTADHRSLAANLAKCHSAIYLPRDNSGCDLPSLIRRGVSAFVKSMHKTDGFPATQTEHEAFLPAIVLSLGETSKWIDGCEGKPSFKTYDFYTDENLEQAQRLVDAIEKCRARLQVLADAWPENVTLQDALETCREILSFPNDSPVAKLLPKVERLHGSLNEWQSVASSQYSAAEHYHALTQLIISWRRLELTTWPHLFDIEDEKCGIDADSWWFYVFESVIANPARLSETGGNLNNHIFQLVSTLAAFITSSPIGQFPDRLRLLQTFEQHVLHLSRENPEMLAIQKGLKNLITYYSQYVPIAMDFLMKERKTFEKKVSEVVLLASWKDTNILALRDSAKRSHRKLYRVVKKYRETLTQPMQPLIEGGMPSEEDSAVISLPGILRSDINIELVKEIYEKWVQRWDNRPFRLTDLVPTVRTMQRVSQSGIVDAAGWLSKFSTSIVAVMKELQAETPGTLTETNKPEVKHLKTRKRKAFVDVLRELRQMGLKWNLSSSQLDEQSTLEAVLTTTEIVHTGNDENESYYFLRVLELLPKIRKSAAGPTPDLTGPEVARSVGYIENMFSMILEQREVISSSLRDLRNVQQVMERYRALSNLEMERPDLYGDSSIVPEEYANIRRKLLWLPDTLGLAIKLLSIHADCSGIELEDAKVFFEKSREAAINLDACFRKALAIHDGVWEHSAMMLMDRAVGALLRMNSDAEYLRQKRPEISYIIRPITTLLSRECQARALTNADSSVSLQIIDTSLQGLCDLVFVSLQKLKDSRTSYPPSSQQTGWLAQCQSASASSMRSLHMGDIARRAAETLALVARLQPSDTTAAASQAARALFAAYYPIVQEYTIICQEALREALCYYCVTSKTVYILCKSATALLTKGFCMPEEKGQGEETSGANGLESGTGLGEGEGADDISKDIKADEDLSELAQEKNREEREKEIESEKDAIDIESEMEGEFGDMSDRGDDGEKGSGDEEENDMDEETGGVDDLDPTAIDEKLWTGKGDDSAKEKEGGKIEGEENKGEDIEAKKENNENQHSLAGKEEELEMGDASDDEGKGADEEDEVRPEATKAMDSHVPEVDTLDLPEDLELDGDEKGDEDGDLNMDDLSDIVHEEEPVQNDEGKDEKKECFPELDSSAKDPESGELEDARDENGNEGERTEQEGEVNEEEIDQGHEAPEDQEQNSLLQTHEEQKSGEAEETAPNEAQAHGGGADQQDSNEQNSAQQQSGEEAKSGEPPETNGADADQEHGQKFGQASVQDASPQSDGQISKDEHLKEEQESFRKVGDVLEKWHRSRREILNAQKDTKRPQVDNMELDDPEFEHLPDEEAVADTQALGAATEDQAHSLDDSMAIDSGTTQPQETFEDDESELKEGNAKEDEMKSSEDRDAGNLESAEECSVGAIIGKSLEPKSRQQIFPREDAESNLEPEDMDMTDEELGGGDSSPPQLANSRSWSESRELWRKHEQSTKDLSMGLCEQLRLILEPTLATKMRGDFRTGKRLNMKRIIPYIASQYKKDKIWMRRTKPSKRQYQVMIAVDDSKSMAESNSVNLAFETVTLVAKALSQLEVGQISIVSFGETTRLIHPFDQPFTSESGVKIFQSFTFSQTKTNVKTLVEKSLSIFESARTNSNASLWQLEIIVSDGVCEDHDTLRRLVRKAQEEKIMIVFVIVDSVRETSILTLEGVKFERDENGGTALKMYKYLDSFPFGFYLVVSDIKELPGVLALALRQWLAEIVDATVM